MVASEVKFAIFTYILYIVLILLIFFNQQFLVLGWMLSFKILLGFLLTLILLFLLPHSDVTKRAAFLGCIFATGVLFNVDEYYFGWRYLGWYLCAMSFFHFSEYVMTALYNADKLSTDSFLLNHSPEYKIAAVVSWVEFAIEFYLYPVMKTQSILSFVGLCLVIFGEVMRKLAMVTGKSNFTHLVQFTKRKEHILVTWGIYSWFRHPGYVGWFYWSIGMLPVIFLRPIYMIWEVMKILNFASN